MRTLRSLRVQILLWTILPLSLILIVVSLGSINLHQSSMRNMVAERDADLIGFAATNLDAEIQSRSLALSDIFSETVGAGKPVRPHYIFDRGIAVISADGKMVASTPNDWELIKRNKNLGDFVVAPGEPTYRLVETPAEPWILVISFTDPETNLTIIGAVSPEGLGLPKLFDQLNRNSRTETYLISPDGQVIFHSDPTEIGRDYIIHSGVREALNGNTGASFEQLPGEDEHVVGYAPVSSLGWVLLLEEPWEDVIVPGLQYTLWAPILVLVAAVASLGAIQFGIWRIIQPLQTLGREASRLSWGEFHALEKPVGGIREIQDLQTTLQEMAEQIKRYQDGMRDYIAVLTQTQEEERKRLARELHDVIVQSIIALGQRVKLMQFDFLEKWGDTNEPASVEVEQRLADFSDRIGQCLADVRALIRDLRPIYLEELGLPSSLEALIRGAASENVEVSFEILGNERPLSGEEELALYRIAQAAINNSVRHGQPTLIILQLDFRDEGIVLSIEDDGVGFTPPERPGDLALAGHYGLVGIHERSVRLGGHLSIRSAPGEGTRIAAFIPGKSRERLGQPAG